MQSPKMTEREFAKVVGVSVYTVARARKARRIDYHQYGAIVYYLPEDVEAWHRQNKHEAIWGRQEKKVG